MSDFAARAELGFQRRSIPLTDFELRADDDAKSWSFEGVACTVDHPYSVRDWLGEYTETIAGGSFKRTLNDPAAKVSLHVNHQHGKAVPLATRHAGTLAVSADPHLRFAAELDPARPDVQILRSALRRGEMSEMSIGFMDVKDGVEWNEDYTERTVTDLRLREASIVEDGCNDLTTATIRSLATELARFNGADIDEQEVRRAIAWLTGLLPIDLSTATDTDIEVEVLETVERSGLFVSDEMIELWAKRLAA